MLPSPPLATQPSPTPPSSTASSSSWTTLGQVWQLRLRIVSLQILGLTPHVHSISSLSTFTIFHGQLAKLAEKLEYIFSFVVFVADLFVATEFEFSTPVVVTPPLRLLTSGKRKGGKVRRGGGDSASARRTAD